jgi:hypothetical protein
MLGQPGHRIEGRRIDAAAGKAVLQGLCQAHNHGLAAQFRDGLNVADQASSSRRIHSP